MSDTEVKVLVMPKCDIHNRKHDAAYDGKTIMGPWAFMCQSAFEKYGRGLGLGLGQRLVLTKD